jgi:hypothetical protein
MNIRAHGILSTRFQNWNQIIAQMLWLVEKRGYNDTWDPGLPRVGEIIREDIIHSECVNEALPVAPPT